MKCKKCGNSIPEGSVFCNWCGEKQIRSRKKAGAELKVPKPTQMSSGKWFIRLRINGENRNVTESTERACIEKARALKAGLLTEKRLRSDVASLTLEGACTAYIAKIEGRLSPSTKQGYEKIVRMHFPELMKKKLGDINDKTIQAAIDAECKRISRRGKPYAPKTVNAAYFFIADVLDAYDVTHGTPRLPEEKKRPVQILTAEQVYEAIKGTEIELPCLLAMWLTFTISEIRGFTKSKSIRNGQISVMETVVDIGGKPVRKEAAKEAERARTQNIPPYIQQLIDDVDGDVICPLSSQATNKRLQRRLEKFGYPVISFHKLRHISASTSVALNIPAAYVKDRGGWVSDYVVNRVYTHTFPKERLEADKKMDDFFSDIINAQNVKSSSNSSSEKKKA